MGYRAPLTEPRRFPLADLVRAIVRHWRWMRSRGER